MRSLIAVAVVVGLFAGVLYLGGNALGVWKDVPDQAAIAAEAGTTSTERVESAPPAKQSTRRPKKVAANKAAVRKRQDPHAPGEHLIGADMAIARTAVLHASDMNSVGSWKRIRVSANEGPGCPQNDPDLSRFTVTGKAVSAFEASDSRIDSRVKVFANGGQAALYFDATSNRTVLHCIRDGVKRALRKAGLQPRILYARLQREPAIGSQTAIYLIGYVITLSDGTQVEYPVDVLNFQVGRAVAGVAFSLVPSDDGSRPCSCELDEARLVASRLYRT